MNNIMTVMFLIGVYFMLGGQDAYSRFGISFRNQIKYLTGMFAVYAAVNLVRVVNGFTIGVFPGFALIMFIVDVFIIYHYAKQII